MKKQLNKKELKNIAAGRVSIAVVNEYIFLRDTFNETKKSWRPGIDGVGMGNFLEQMRGVLYTEAKNKLDAFEALHKDEMDEIKKIASQISL